VSKLGDCYDQQYDETYDSTGRIYQNRDQPVAADIALDSLQTFGLVAGSPMSADCVRWISASSLIFRFASFRLAQTAPVNHHPSLRQREGDKNSQS